MPKIIRCEFMGSWVLFWLLCVTVVLIPIAVLYLFNGILRIEHDIDDPERFVADYRAGKGPSANMCSVSASNRRPWQGATTTAYPGDTPRRSNAARGGEGRRNGALIRGRALSSEGSSDAAARPDARRRARGLFRCRVPAIPARSRRGCPVAGAVG